MDYIGIVLGVVAGLVLVYLFVVMPRMCDRPDRTPLFGSYYAHRGLHDNETQAPENSMAAFRKAVEAGYGIELDVQLTKDMVPVIFHDETLDRVCGVTGKVFDYTYEELKQFHLCKSEERIPLLKDVLEMVAGKVPLIIEIKAYGRAAQVCTVADKLISKYQGVYCIESFDPRAVAWYKKHRPEVIRGQLGSNFRKSERKEDMGMFCVHYLLANCYCKPDFIAYDHHYKRNLSRRIACNLYGALSVAWTIRSQAELNAAKDEFSLFIFEKFRPEE